MKLPCDHTHLHGDDYAEPIVTYGETIIGYYCKCCMKPWPYEPCAKCGKSVMAQTDCCFEKCNTCETNIIESDPKTIPTCASCAPLMIKCIGCEKWFASIAQRFLQGLRYCSNPCKQKTRRKRQKQKRQNLKQQAQEQRQ